MATLPARLLDGTRREYPIECLFSPPQPRPLSPGERHLLCMTLPPWQRPEVWDVERKRRFVEGIFLGLGTGYYVVHGPDWDGGQAKPMSHWLIDGQQRLSAIRDFHAGELAIFGGIRYGDIDAVERRRRFGYAVFPSIEIPYTRDESLLRELYERLNFGGVPHTPADLERVRHDFAGGDHDDASMRRQQQRG